MEIHFTRNIRRKHRPILQYADMGFISMQESGLADKQQGAITSVLP